MKVLHNRHVVVGGCAGYDGVGHKWTSLLSIYALVFLVSIYSLDGFSDSQAIRDQLNPIVNRESLTKNNTDAAITVNFHFGDGTPEKVHRIQRNARGIILKQLNHRRKRNTATSAATTAINDEPTTITHTDAAITNELTTITNEPTTVRATDITITTTVHNELTEPVTFLIFMCGGWWSFPGRKRRCSRDVEGYAGETIARHKRDDTREDDLYTEEDLAFVNITEWFKYGDLRTPIFINDDKDLDFDADDWISVGDRLFDAATAVKEELANMAGVSNVTITRGVPDEAPILTKNSMESADIIVWLGIVADIGVGLIIVICMIVFYYWIKNKSNRKKMSITAKDGPKVLIPTKISFMEVSNGLGPASFASFQNHHLGDDEFRLLIQSDHLSNGTL